MEQRRNLELRGALEQGGGGRWVQQRLRRLHGGQEQLGVVSP
jgi:hypothetical protein